MSSRSVFAIYACLGAVYLLYLPHALPVLDDWTYLQAFSQAHARGLAGEIDLLRRLADNSIISQFRVFWVGFLPVLVVSLAAGLHGWPYYLLALLAHGITAVLLAGIVSLLAGDDRTGFIAGAIYMVFPAANGALFWPIATSFYYVQALAFSAWFYYTWRKVAAAGDYRYGWKDFVILVPTVFTGEQILPLLVGLLPASWWIFGRPKKHRRFFQYCAIHTALLMGLISIYILALNRMPVLGGFQHRYHNANFPSLWAIPLRLLAALGLRPSLAEWRPSWRPELPLLVLLIAAAAAFALGLRRREPNAFAASPLRLLVWSAAGAFLTFLPVVSLPGIEWRYLYVPAAFLGAAAAAMTGWTPPQARAILGFLAVAYGISLTYFEMRQCWIPESREAQAIISTVENAVPIRPGEIFIFAHAPHAMGTAPSFIAGASWSLNSLLLAYAPQVQGARELLVNEQGDLALYRRDSIVPFSRDAISRLRVYVRDAGGHYVRKSLLALPAPDRRYQLLPLQTGVRCPPQPLTIEELQRLALYGDTYFAHFFSGPFPHA
jgi:hypothetical protein